jgi:hypothetical protein
MRNSEGGGDDTTMQPPWYGNTKRYREYICFQFNGMKNSKFKLQISVMSFPILSSVRHQLSGANQGAARKPWAKQTPDMIVEIM